MSVDPRAASGFAHVARAYAQGRPSYPTEAINHIAGSFQLNEASTVLDLAAGTGQLSRRFRSRVGHVIAVEPASAMRATITAELSDVTVVDGTAEAIPLADGAVDAVVIGEAFHWFATQAATAEIARVLRPDGGIALLWNTPTWTDKSTHWLKYFRRIVAHHKQAAADYPTSEGRWRDELEHTGLFTDLQHAEFAHTQLLEPADFLALVSSWSWIANLDDHDRQTTLDDVDALLERERRIEIPYRTDLYLARSA
ncbi:class I SAM-dependent methyltransferase [Dietzia sp. CQ4]|uniref:class I SAM-dependent methyltransferase n=1 Tax=Dietzia sp. (strain CQ4) TaxID=370437 RepID=UPI0015FD706A|nr:class I SAM-dependent methyltransferase [Dietzia sp. CQ4]MBB1033561.1 class I SAM-dependent methyltransferase [Dietzia sp. CQ4]